MSFSKNLNKCVWGLSVLIVMFPAMSMAESSPQAQSEVNKELGAKSAVNQEVRFRLRESANPSSMMATGKDTSETQAFHGNLGRSGLQFGADPVVGEGSGKSYYDFHDGLKHPEHIVITQ